ncbi:MAG: winged helix-turn-helix transcriptional regulator [Candidatus Eisenbacteria bacterium]|uniref:Winged helix-turn-helix transcriptional regulator n=1 Tax=Eiseniibacteriota bacterium TaxID=2212470 RepID=A0A956NFS0_UNCEI|nr:winged helix-turn-helix transcriptional regulator [Candidatus Eisenbacteria bacterium]
MVTDALPRSVFSAIADPTRRAILDRMRHGEVGAGELAEQFPVSRPAIARHVRILRAAGLVRQRVAAQRRYYSLRPEALQAVDQWLAPYRLFWSARMTDLKLYLENETAQEENADE